MATVKRKRQDKEPDEETETLYRKVRLLAGFAAEKKAVDIRAYDIRGLSLVADALVLCTATSEPQVKAVFHAVESGMEKEGISPLRTEGSFSGGWLLMDYGTVIFHLFREQARKYYDLDGFWGDAKEIPLEANP